MSDQRKIIFLHLPKTAGTSLVNILHQEYRLENSALIAGDDQAALEEAVEGSKSFIHGHFSFQLLNHPLAQSYYKATLLRDAADRVISRYVHLAYSKEERLQAEFATYSGFDDYLKSTYADNWQCRMLAGIWHEGKVNDEVFERAKQNLEKLDWVATTSAMPEAALDLSLKLGFESYYQPQLNKRKSKALWQEINSNYRPQIEALNHFDSKLVSLAEARYRSERKVPLLKGLKLRLKGS